MSRALAHRLTRLEQQTQARNAPMWNEDARLPSGYAPMPSPRSRPYSIARTCQDAMRHRPVLIAPWLTAGVAPMGRTETRKVLVSGFRPGSRPFRSAKEGIVWTKRPTIATNCLKTPR
jgi:hypothetical protein